MISPRNNNEHSIKYADIQKNIQKQDEAFQKFYNENQIEEKEVEDNSLVTEFEDDESIEGSPGGSDENKSKEEIKKEAEDIPVEEEKLDYEGGEEEEDLPKQQKKKGDITYF